MGVLMSASAQRRSGRQCLHTGAGFSDFTEMWVLVFGQRYVCQRLHRDVVSVSAQRCVCQCLHRDVGLLSAERCGYLPRYADVCVCTEMQISVSAQRCGYQCPQ